MGRILIENETQRYRPSTGRIQLPSMRRLVFLALRYTGIPFLLRVLLQRRRVTILCWHDPMPETMAAHIHWLQRHYNIISLRQYIGWRQERSVAPLPPKALIITLDDGHKSNFALGSVFHSARVPVTIFLCSGIVGTHRHFWWTTVPVEEIGALKRLPDEQRCSRLAALGFDEHREHGNRQALSSEEVVVLKPMVDFQAHTRLHPVLPMCSDARVQDEISGCKTELEQKFGLGVYALAYPNGDYSQREVEIARDAGYECALTLDAGFNTVETDLFRLKRIPMFDKADLNEMIVKSSGLWEFIKWLLCVSSKRYPTTALPESN